MIAKAIMGEKAVCDTVPWFWSDQYDLSLQIAGLPRPRILDGCAHHG